MYEIALQEIEQANGCGLGDPETGSATGARVTPADIKNIGDTVNDTLRIFFSKDNTSSGSSNNSGGGSTTVNRNSGSSDLVTAYLL